MDKWKVFLKVEWCNSNVPLVFTDHKRRKLDSHSSPSHSSSVKVSMAWGRLCPFLLYLPERSLPLHIPAALKITKESCRTCAGMASGYPNQIHGSWKEFHGHQHNILQNWEKTPQGLSQENIVYIEYFHIEILIYFHINESSQCALAEKEFFKAFLYSSWIFCFLRMSAWSKMACQSKSFCIFQGQRFFFLTPRAVFHYLKWCPRLFSLFWRAEKIPWLKWCKVFYFPLDVPGSNADSDGGQQTPLL